MVQVRTMRTVNINPFRRLVATAVDANWNGAIAPIERYDFLPDNNEPRHRRHGVAALGKDLMEPPPTRESWSILLVKSPCGSAYSCIATKTTSEVELVEILGLPVHGDLAARRIDGDGEGARVLRARRRPCRPCRWRRNPSGRLWSARRSTPRPVVTCAFAPWTASWKSRPALGAGRYGGLLPTERALALPYVVPGRLPA